mmetsp:Transcript_16986/g.31929  ORF Transcript_16986/g.31929 Transcript_16986/m.31929 type:complete len:249 (+) Transcript_16986:255-1001(+)
MRNLPRPRTARRVTNHARSTPPQATNATTAEASHQRHDDQSNPSAHGTSVSRNTVAAIHHARPNENLPNGNTRHPTPHPDINKPPHRPHPPQRGTERQQLTEQPHLVQTAQGRRSTQQSHPGAVQEMTESSKGAGAQRHKGWHPPGTRIPRANGGESGGGVHRILTLPIFGFIFLNKQINQFKGWPLDTAFVKGCVGILFLHQRSSCTGTNAVAARTRSGRRTNARHHICSTHEKYRAAAAAHYFSSP